MKTVVQVQVLIFPISKGTSVLRSRYLKLTTKAGSPVNVT
ncbi:tail protein [Salmonella phage 21]|nr:tail protein [Salmonella phage 21]